MFPIPDIVDVIMGSAIKRLMMMSPAHPHFYRLFTTGHGRHRQKLK